MTPHQKRVEATARAMDSDYRRHNDGHITPWALLDGYVRKAWLISARWHLRMGGRAPGEMCGNCGAKSVVTCSFCSRKYKDNWRPKGGAR